MFFTGNFMSNQKVTTAGKLTCASSTGCRQSNADAIAGGFSEAFRVTAGGRAQHT